MKVKIDRALIGLDGKPFNDEGNNPLTVRNLLKIVLLTSGEEADDKNKAAAKIARFDLTKLLLDEKNDEFDFRKEEIELIRKMASYLPTEIYGVLMYMLEGKM